MFYRKIAVFIFFVTLVVNSHAQKYSISINGGFQKYVDPKNMEGTFSGGKMSGSALTVEAGYEGFIEKYKKLKVSLLADYYSGKIAHSEDEGLITGRRYESENLRVGLSISPYSFELAKNLIVRPAAEINLLAINGGTLYSIYKADSLTLAIFPREEATSISREIYNFYTAGGSLSISYKIPFGNRWYIAPTYRYYHGLVYEFKKEELPLVSRRHQLGILVGWK